MQRFMSLWMRADDKKPPKPRSLFGNLIASMKARLEGEPENVALRWTLVTHLARAKRYEEAIEQVKLVLGREPHHVKAKGLLVRLRVERRLAWLHRP
jgi:hypothetical protein